MPAFVPLSFHRYCGAEPPFITDVVKTTFVPAQTGLAEGVIDTLTGNNGFTVTTTALDMAGLFMEQIALEVSRQATASPVIGI